MKPKKLIRERTGSYLKDEEKELITDKDELNKLYELKIKEEVLEVINSNFTDILEFADCLEVIFSWAEQNGFHRNQLMNELVYKQQLKGSFNNLVLTNLNPHNKSNDIYFKQ